MPYLRPTLAPLVLVAGCYLHHGLEPRDHDAGPAGDVDAGVTTCASSDPSTWAVERFDAGGDYDRAVAATSGVPWIALRRADGDLVFLRVGVRSSGIVIEERVDVPGAPLVPLGFDTDGTRFVAVTTTGLNWNGVVEAVWLDRSSGAVERRVWDALGPDSSFTVRGAAALLGDLAVFAAVRADTDVAHVEMRGADLGVVTERTQPGAYSVLAIRRAADEIDLVFGGRTSLRVTAREMLPGAGGPAGYDLIGGQGAFVVEHAADFRVRRGDEVWSGPWPHTQISPPAVLRRIDARAAFSLTKELSGAVGYTHEDRLEWLHVEPAPGASGAGSALMPVVEASRLGLFYLGLEIPRPERPLRYYGVVCE